MPFTSGTIKTAGFYIEECVITSKRLILDFDSDFHEIQRIERSVRRQKCSLNVQHALASQIVCTL